MKIDTNLIAKSIKSAIGNSSSHFRRKETLVGRFARTSLLLLFVLCSMVSAAQVEVTLTTAGTLSEKIGDDQKLTITNLKVSGPINGTDVKYLREMAGTDGQLVELDLTDANIAEGGESYCSIGVDKNKKYYYTASNVIGDYMFSGCNLKSIKLPNSVTSIGQYAFIQCTGLTSVTIGNSVTSIGKCAFVWCSGLTSVTIPNSVTSIGYGAFGDCSGLTSVTIGNSVKSIDNAAFANCTGLKKVIVEDIVAWCGISFIDLNSNPLNNAHHLYSDENTEIKDLKIPDGVTSIGQYAFYDCTGLTSVTIPNSVTSIGDLAFKGCSSLTSVTIPNSVTSIGYRAFAECTGLTSVTIPNSVTSIGDGAFNGCSGLTSVTIGNSVKSIGESAFYGCSSLASITIPNSVTSIGQYAFEGCTSLTSATIGNSVTSIGDLAFKGCSSLTSIAVEEGNAYYHVDGNCLINTASNTLIRGCNLTSVTIPNSVTSIGDYAFENCSRLTSVTIPNSVESIGNYAFNGCSSLTSIAVEEGNAYYHVDGSCLIETASNTLIRGCNLTSVTIPNSVTSIGDYAFENCSRLTSVTIPNSVESIGNYAFNGCSSLTSIAVEEGNAYYHVDGSCLIETASNTLIRGCNLTSVTIPNSVTSIGGSAFNGCSSLASVTIPNSVTSIGGSAFSGCSSLTSVTIPNSVTSIGYSAFNRCSGLKKVIVEDIVAWCGISFSLNSNPLSIAHHLYSDENTEIKDLKIPDGVTSIGYYAFENCSSLTSVTIPNSVKSIGFRAFQGCSSLTEVTLQSETLPSCGYGPFSNIPSDATLYCKASLIETCKTTTPWSGFSKIVAIPFSIIISDAGIATACFDDDLDFTEMTDVKAYIASGFSPSEGKVLLTRAMKIPAKTGFIVKGNAGTYKIPVSATDYTYANLLVGTLAETTVAETDGSYTNYVLGKDSEGKACFCLANVNTVSANKAYLHIPTSAVSTETSGAKTSLNLSFDDEDGDITGFIPVTKLAEETNGKSAIYNLNGQRKQSLTKGLNIVNGKKVLVR